MYLLDRSPSNCVLGIVQKPLARRGAWALLWGVWTYNLKVIELQSFHELKNKKITFIVLLFWL